MSITIKTQNLQNCTSNITESEIPFESEIVLIADAGYYFKEIPTYNYYDSEGYTIRQRIDLEKITNFQYAKIISEYDNRIVGITGKTAKAISVIYDLNNCDSDNEKFTVPNENFSIILTAKDGFIFKDNPYIKIENVKNYIEVEEIFLEKNSDYIYSLTIDKEKLTTEINAIYVFGVAIEKFDNFEESEINDNISYGLLSIYNPTKAELLELTKRTFLNGTNYADLEQNIFALRKVYFNIPQIEKDVIRIGGNVTTTVQANIVKNEIINADCGNIEVEEYYKNSFDYEGFTNARIYLPFIGFKDIEVNNIMNSTVYLFYRLNVITGRIVTILKTNKRGKIYTFQGTGGFDLFLSLNHYTAYTNKNVNYESEYMTGLTPYLQLFTKIPYNVDNNPYGYNVNEWKKLSDINGYVECKEIQFLPVNDYITLNEVEEIKSLCKQGIFL